MVHILKTKSASLKSAVFEFEFVLFVALQPNKYEGKKAMFNAFFIKAEK